MASSGASAEALPFFVYGTLLPGYGNHDRTIRGRLDRVERGVRLPGARIYHYEYGFPGMVRARPSDDSSHLGVVTGALLYAPADEYLAVLADCDRLEGFTSPGAEGNMYEREIVEVLLPSGAFTRAWTYFSLVDNAAATPVPSGDWHAFMQSNRHLQEADN